MDLTGSINVGGKHKMKNWKRNSKRVLVLLLMLGLIGGMTEHWKVTVAAADLTDAAKTESSETAKDTTEEDTSQPTCICTAPCAAGTENPDCPVCKENVSACAGIASDGQGENNDTNSGEGTAEEPVEGLQMARSLDAASLDGSADAYAQVQLAAAPQVQEAWDAMTAAMANWEAEIDLSGYNLTESDMTSIWPDVAQDNPDLFYVLSCYYTISGGIIQTCQFQYNTAYNQDSVAEYKAAIERVFAEVIQGNMSDEQKATALHDYLVQHMVYDQNANNNLGTEKRNAYEALVNGIGVCQGYTLAYAALLEKAGIEYGYCKSAAMNHIWNYVKLDGEWYHADLTFDDATASSQVGETGYVQHSNFLLSDDAMSQTHNWDANAITCSSKKYDASWHKTSPLKESAIYTVNGSSYFLKSETVSNNPDICRGASLVRRGADGTETTVGTFEIENLGNGWPTYNMCFSRLSCSRGVLYFNVGNSVYSFNPSVNTDPVNIYQYSDASNRIVSGLLAYRDEMTIEIYNPQSMKIEEKINAPIFTLTASEQTVSVGYTTAPVLTANPLASGFIWSKQRPDGGWDTISGANSSSYTIESGLPEGSYRYRVEATLDGRAVSAEIIVTVTAQTEYKIEVKDGISKVPDSFQSKEHLNTPEKIEAEMRLKIQERSADIPDADIAVYDVELLVNVAGLGWQPATKDSFPADGLTVTLSYPSGTGKDTHDFTVAHMFTADMNGFVAGDVEYPTVAKTESGITFKVYGLSPVAVGWKEINGGSSGDNGSSGNTPSGGDNGSSGNTPSGGDNDPSGSTPSNGNDPVGSNESSGTSGTSASSVRNTKAPLTGDAAPTALYTLLAAASLAVAVGYYIRTKKIR